LKLKILNVILIVDILSLLLILSILFIPSTIARVILGLPFLLFFPGFTLISALFAKKDRMDNIELLALSGAMSIAIVALIGFGLNYSSWGIRLEPVLYSVWTFIFITSAIALIRRAHRSKIHIFVNEITLVLPRWEDSLFNKIFSIILITAIFSALGVLAIKLAVPAIEEQFTEFYILGITGKAQDYPIEYDIKDGQITQVVYGDGTTNSISGLGIVNLGIVNHQQKTVGYFVKMTIDDKPAVINFGGTNMDILGPIDLKTNEKWENAIGIAPQRAGDNQKVKILLFRGAEVTPENSLQLLINVNQTE